MRWSALLILACVTVTLGCGGDSSTTLPTSSAPKPKGGPSMGSPSGEPAADPKSKTSSTTVPVSKD